MDKTLLKILACPECKNSVRLQKDDTHLICGTCNLTYAISDGIPRMVGQEVHQTSFDFYNAPDEERYGREELIEFSEMIEKLLTRFSSNAAEEVVVDLGCGKGPLQGCHPNYIGIDLSYYSLKQYLDSAKSIQADMEKVPLANESVDFVFSIAALEHISRPESCFAEVNRILKPGGVAFLYPSWFCRPWAAKGLHKKRFRELNLWDKINKSTIPIRNNLIFRAAYTIPRRACVETSYGIWPRKLSFRYKKLKPNLEQYLAADSDAFSSMDPHTAIMYFRSRHYEIISAKTLQERLFVRHTPVIVRKPGI
jgi:uncharacterized protein YbaR (Trm112 family)/ubiquinone/menaquinone biosynthesis C-methylase UbiE